MCRRQVQGHQGRQGGQEDHLEGFPQASLLGDLPPPAHPQARQGPQVPAYQVMRRTGRGWDESRGTARGARRNAIRLCGLYARDACWCGGRRATRIQDGLLKKAAWPGWRRVSVGPECPLPPPGGRCAPAPASVCSRGGREILSALVEARPLPASTTRRPCVPNTRQRAHQSPSSLPRAAYPPRSALMPSRS